MKYLLKNYWLAIIFIGVSLNAQNFQGKAVYQTKTTFDLKLDSTQVTPEQQKRIEARMKDMLENVYELDFNTSTSLYKKEEKLAQPGQSGGRGFMGSMDGGDLFKDTKSKTFTHAQDLMGKLFLVKDSLSQLDWQFKDDSKMIGKHLCFKATAKREVSNTEIRFGRRGSQNNDKPKDSLKEIEVVAWYTPEIPVSHGPGEYWGLPGLILEINADKTQIVCTKIVINPKEKAAIKAPKKGTVVGQEEFDKIRTKKTQEMQEMFNSRRRDGQGRRR